MAPLSTERLTLATESGIGVVEVLTAVILVTVGLLGSLAAFDGASRTTLDAQRHEQAISLAQREIERLEAIPFGDLALATAPPHVTDPDPNNPNDPRAFVEAGDLLVKRDYHDAAAGPPAGMTGDREPLVVDSSSPHAVSPGPEQVPIGPPSPSGAQANATVYRFVTERAESCLTLPDGSGQECPEAAGSKRLLVAVTAPEAAGGSALLKPVYVSSVVTAAAEEGQP